MKTESEMQEIFVDSDSLEELIMVIEDVFAKRKIVQVKSEVFTMSHLVMKIRIAEQSNDDSYQNQREIILIDLSELNEPIEALTEMYHTLASNERSLTIETRICQTIFEKNKKSSSFKLMTFINSASNDQKVSRQKPTLN